MIVDESIKSLLKQLVQDLVTEKYTNISAGGRIGRLTEEELLEAIKSYGGKLTLPPENEFETLEIYQVRDSDQYAVDFELWVNGQKSDLTLSCTVTVVNENNAQIAIDDLHVL